LNTSSKLAELIESGWKPDYRCIQKVTVAAGRSEMHIHIRTIIQRIPHAEHAGSVANPAELARRVAYYCLNRAANLARRANSTSLPSTPRLSGCWYKPLAGCGPRTRSWRGGNFDPQRKFALKQEEMGIPLSSGSRPNQSAIARLVRRVASPHLRYSDTILKRTIRIGPILKGAAS
jgi:hypothetical protein